MAGKKKRERHEKDGKRGGSRRDKVRDRATSVTRRRYARRRGPAHRRRIRLLQVRHTHPLEHGQHAQGAKGADKAHACQKPRSSGRREAQGARSTFQEMREIPEFLVSLGKETAVDVVPGNHDPDLKNFLPENVRLRPSSITDIQSTVN